MAGLDDERLRKTSQAELAVLVSQYGRVQTRCSLLIADQRAQIEALQAQQVRLCAQLIIRVTALQFEREDRARLEAMAPGLPRRAMLARQVEQLRARLENLLRERTTWRWGAERRRDPPPPALASGGAAGEPVAAAAAAPLLEGVGSDPPACGALQAAQGGCDALGRALLEAELLICRTGCISHGDYWRVKDHCRRTGKPCLLIDEHQAIHVVRQGDRVVVQARAVRPFEK